MKNSFLIALFFSLFFLNCKEEQNNPLQTAAASSSSETWTDIKIPARLHIYVDQKRFVLKTRDGQVTRWVSPEQQLNELGQFAKFAGRNVFLFGKQSESGVFIANRMELPDTKEVIWRAK
ncbi:MAG: hypothetical protein AAB438_03040 [Patescibacteria group bacterium]